MLHFCNVSGLCASFHTGPITCGVSSWISLPLHRDAFIAYNKLTIDSYFSYSRFTGYIGFPVLYTIDKRDYSSINGTKIPGDTILNRIALGDMSAYIGIRIGRFEPRIGIIIPLGYPTNSGVWLGSKNLILKTGLGFSGNLSSKLRLKYGGEIYFKYYVTGFPEIIDSQGKKGSWSIEPDLKITAAPTKKIRVGIETLCGFKKFYAKWLLSGSLQGYELSSSIVPHLIASWDLSSKLYLSGKAGFGPQFKSKVDSSPDDNNWNHTGYAVNIGISAGFYP